MVSLNHCASFVPYSSVPIHAENNDMNNYRAEKTLLSVSASLIPLMFIRNNARQSEIMSDKWVK